MSTSASFLLPTFVAPPGSTQPGLVYQPDHVGEAASRLLRQHDSAARLHALVRALVRPAQQLEQSAFEVMGAFDVGTAYGAQLDVIGGFVGVQREGRSDIAYRAYIHARILGNASDGAIETILKIARVLLGASGVSFKYVHGRVADGMPAHFQLFATANTLRFPWDPSGVEPPNVVAIALADALFLAVAAGVSFSLFYQYTAEADTFLFSSVGDAEEPSTTQGLADTSDTGAGGALIGVETRF